MAGWQLGDDTLVSAPAYQSDVCAVREISEGRRAAKIVLGLLFSIVARRHIHMSKASRQQRLEILACTKGCIYN